VQKRAIALQGARFPSASIAETPVDNIEIDDHYNADIK